MPQKQNPDALELIRGKCARVNSAAQQLLVIAKGLPLAYNKDMQETQEPVFEVTATMSMMLEVATGFMREVGFNLERMAQAATTGFMDAMAAATYLTGKGVPFRRAHEIIGTAVRTCLEKECELRDLSLAELRAISPEFAEDFYAAIALEAVLDCHNVVGGTARAQVAAALERTAERIAQLKGAVHAGA
jgi:argininosuccinate lyase